MCFIYISNEYTGIGAYRGLKKKLLFIVEAMGGGVFTYIVDLANELVVDYDVYIAYNVRPQTPIEYKEYFDKRIKLIRVKNFERSISPKKDIKAFFELRKIAKQVKPDIIHLHSSKAGVLGRIAFAFGKTPIYYTPHGFSFLMRGVGSKKRAVYHLIESICSLGGATTIACSPGEYDEALKLTKKSKLVNNGINIADLKDYRQQSANGNGVVTLGRVTYQKNPRLFNDIALALPNENFTWIGNGELANELSAKNIDVTGWLSRKEALNQIIDSDIFVLTSLWEGLPLSLLEAMYLGKICIVSDVVGNRDVIKNGVNGFICKTPLEYANTIKAIKNGDVDTKKIVANAYNDIITLYNTKVMAKQYKDIYND